MKRIRVAERMDNPELPADAHRHALCALDRTNRLLGANRRLARDLMNNTRKDRIVVLDIGAGGGGLLADIERHAQSCGVAVAAVALDNSLRALRFSQHWHDVYVVQGDARRIPLTDRAVDVIVCSLLLHHFDQQDVIAILREAARTASCAVIMHDLVRSRAALFSTRIAAHVLTRSPVFHTDAVRSVRAAWTPCELQEIASRAGLQDSRITCQFPFRMTLVWQREGVRRVS